MENFLDWLSTTTTRALDIYGQVLNTKEQARAAAAQAQAQAQAQAAAATAQTSSTLKLVLQIGLIVAVLAIGFLAFRYIFKKR